RFYRTGLFRTLCTDLADHGIDRFCRTVPTAISCRSGGEDARREVAVATVAHDVDDDRVLRLRAHLHRRREPAAGGDAREDALLGRQAPRHLLALLLRDLDDTVHARAVEDQ
ncbi:hypothetical protein LDC_1735, partial [sediment metagenome]